MAQLKFGETLFRFRHDVSIQSLDFVQCTLQSNTMVFPKTGCSANIPAGWHHCGATRLAFIRLQQYRKLSTKFCRELITVWFASGPLHLCQCLFKLDWIHSYLFLWRLPIVVCLHAQPVTARTARLIHVWNSSLQPSVMLIVRCRL